MTRRMTDSDARWVIEGLIKFAGITMMLIGVLLPAMRVFVAGGLVVCLAERIEAFAWKATSDDRR